MFTGYTHLNRINERPQCSCSRYNCHGQWAESMNCSPEAAINDVCLTPLLQCLIEGLSAGPRVASNVCAG